MLVASRVPILYVFIEVYFREIPLVEVIRAKLFSLSNLLVEVNLSSEVPVKTIIYICFIYAIPREKYGIVSKEAVVD